MKVDIIPAMAVPERASIRRYKWDGLVDLLSNMKSDQAARLEPPKPTKPGEPQQDPRAYRRRVKQAMATRKIRCIVVCDDKYVYIRLREPRAAK